MSPSQGHNDITPSPQFLIVYFSSLPIPSPLLIYRGRGKILLQNATKPFFLAFSLLIHSQAACSSSSRNSLYKALLTDTSYPFRNAPK